MNECKNHKWRRIGSEKFGHWECDSCFVTRTLDPNKRPVLMELGSELGTLIQKGEPKPTPRGKNPVEALIKSRRGNTTQELWRELFSQLEPDKETVKMITKSQSLSLIETVIKLLEAKKRGA